MDKDKIIDIETYCMFPESHCPKSIQITKKGLPMAESILVTYQTANWEA